jgi:hypothetical protein
MTRLRQYSSGNCFVKTDIIPALSPAPVALTDGVSLPGPVIISLDPENQLIVPDLKAGLFGWIVQWTIGGSLRHCAHRAAPGHDQFQGAMRSRADRLGLCPASAFAGKPTGD